MRIQVLEVRILAGNTTDCLSLSRVAGNLICLMAQQRRRVVIALAVLLLSSLLFPPFSSERPPRSTPHSRLLPSSNSPFQHQHQDIQGLLLTPTFIVHLFWFAGLLSLSLIALVDVVLKLVYVSCTLGVNSVSPPFFPADYTR